MHTHKRSLFLKYSLFLCVYANKQRRLTSLLNVKNSKKSQIFSDFLKKSLWKKRKDCFFRNSPWCEKRDLNPYGESTRPSNVRVYQFRHSRISLTEGGIQAHPLQR